MPSDLTPVSLLCNVVTSQMLIAVRPCVQQTELQKVKDDNFVLAQRLEQERARAVRMQVETGKLTSDLEFGSER